MNQCFLVWINGIAGKYAWAGRVSGGWGYIGGLPVAMVGNTVAFRRAISGTVGRAIGV